MDTYKTNRGLFGFWKITYFIDREMYIISGDLRFHEIQT